ncbi:MAG: outer membrane protein assembly factor BamA [Verrucomicrobia bacterium]|nr:outer membrane protein assembly factor BamA [Verrucomicrobiota bacterium]
MTGVHMGAVFSLRALVFVLIFVWAGLSSAFAQEKEGESTPGKSQTRAKTFVPPPTASDRPTTSGQKKILEIEYSSSLVDVPINEEKIRQNMQSAKGEWYSQETVDKDIENLYATGDYSNVQIIASDETSESGELGYRLSVIVSPKVSISEVEVKRKRADGGLDDQLSVDKEDLLDLKLKALTANEERGAQALTNAFKKKETVTKAGDILSEERLRRDAVAMEDFYRDKGFKDAKVTPVTSQVEGGKAKVTFEVNEGIRGFISKIRFIGNQSVPSEQLQKVVKLKPKAWWELFSKSDRYEEYARKEDEARLKNYYLNKGYIDVQVEGSVDLPRNARNEEAQTDTVKREQGRPEDFDPDDIPAEDLILTYRIEEGRQYRVGNLTVDGNAFFSADDLQNELQNRSKLKEIFDPVELKLLKADGLQSGEVYSVNGLEASKETLQDKYGRRGFREVRIEPQLQPNVETGMIDVNFSIKEGEKFYVGRIEIEGLTTTKEKVVRREIDLAPGEVFDTVREKSSKAKIQGLNYFSQVETYAEETDIPNRQKLIVQVKEKPTGEVSFGAGFSSVELLTGNITLGEKNFDIEKIFSSFPPRGGGQKARLQASLGFRSQNVNLAFTEPWFLDKPLRLDVSGFYNGASYISEFYNQQNFGASIGLSRRLGDDFPLNKWSVGVTYRPEYYNIIDLQSDAPPYYQASTGDTLKSSLRGSIVYDGRDSYMLARNGQFFELGVEGAGGPLLGSENIWKIRAEYRVYFPIWKEKDWILSGRAQVGLVDGFSSTEYVPVWDQLYAGGSGSVRGFDPSLGSTVNQGSVGPKQNGQPVGGGTSGNYQIELTAPFPILEDRVRWALFCDGGFVNENVFDFAPKTYNNTQSMMVNGSSQSYNAVNGGFQIGVGVGVRMDLGIGPMKLDIGFPVMTGDPSNGGGLGAIKFYFDGGYQF